MALEAANELRERLMVALHSPDRGELQRLTALLQPADLATLAADMDVADRIRLLAALDDDMAARVLEELETDDQGEILTRLPQARAAAILSEMSSDEIADLVGDLPENRGQEILGLLHPDDAREIQELLVYPERSAGGMMTPEFVSLSCGMTAQEAIDFLRGAAPEAETIYYLYVTDENQRLVGVVSLRDLISAEPTQRVEAIMSRRVISVPAHTDQEEAAQVLRKYGFLALPVVDDDGMLLGVVTVDDVMDVLTEEVSKDIQRMGGSEPLEERYFSASIPTMVRKRIGWLFVLFIAQSFTGTIMAGFQEQLSAMIALAFFIPLLIDTAGNAGSQAATLVIRSMALGEVRFRDVFKVMARELSIGFILGLSMAAMAFLRAWWMGGPASLGYTVALTILLIVIVAATVGGVLPLIARRLNLDPAAASGPVITTIADGIGLVIYFKMARIIMGI